MSVTGVDAQAARVYASQAAILQLTSTDAAIITGSEAMPKHHVRGRTLLELIVIVTTLAIAAAICSGMITKWHWSPWIVLPIGVGILLLEWCVLTMTGLVVTRVVETRRRGKQ